MLMRTLIRLFILLMEKHSKRTHHVVCSQSIVYWVITQIKLNCCNYELENERKFTPPPSNLFTTP
jgi:hypothetical protein